MRFRTLLECNRRVIGQRPDHRWTREQIGCPHPDVWAKTHPRTQPSVAGYFMKTDTEVSMLFAIAAILLILAVVGGIAVHPLLFLIAILAVVALVAGR